MSTEIWQPFCFGLSVLIYTIISCLCVLCLFVSYIHNFTIIYIIIIVINS